MKKNLMAFRSIIFFILLSYVMTLCPAGLVMAQVNECGYDPANPDLEHARQSFRQINYACAEQELNDLLAQENLDLEVKANAHVLLAAVYYTILRDAQDKEQKVVEEFAQAFRVYQDWSGDLDIKSSRFEELMEKARTQVDTEEAQAPEPAPEQPKESSVKKKPWYTKWWAIALGVGLVAVVVVAASGGGGDGGGTSEPLPDFPDTPSKEKPAEAGRR